MTTEPCNCEHKDHFDFRVDSHGVVDRPRGLHEYMAKPADDQWAQWLGHVCDYCAATCCVGFIVEDHVHGEGDCRRV